MFVFLRLVIRVVSVVAFLFSLWEFGSHFNGWAMIQPSLTRISELRAERAERRAEQAKAGKLSSDPLENIDYEVGSIGEVVTVIRVRTGLLLSLISLVLSSVLILVAWRPDPIYTNKT